MAPKRNKATNQSVYTARQTRSRRLLTQQQPDDLEDVNEEADHQEQDGNHQDHQDGNEAADQDVNREEDHYRHDVIEGDSDAEVVIENEIYRTTRRRGAVISVINLDEESDSDVAVGLHRGGGSSLAQDESATQLASNSARPAHTHTIRTNPTSSSTSQSAESTFGISSSTLLSTEATTMVRANTLDMTVDLISPLRSTTTQVLGGAGRDAATPPRMQNILDDTVDLTDSPITAPGTAFSTNMPTNSSVSTATSASSPLTDSSSPAVTSSASPGSTALIRCPVCLDDLQKIRSAQKTVMSTVCGHLFCSSCLPICLRESRRCPTCRRFLNVRDMHPIFI